MANIRNLKRELASHVRDQAKITKQIEIDTLKDNLEFVPIIIAKDNNHKIHINGNNEHYAALHTY